MQSASFAPSWSVLCAPFRWPSVSQLQMRVLSATPTGAFMFGRTSPSGQLTGGVFGRGLNISDAGGDFVSAGNICNWRIDIDFIDAAGNTYDRVVGKTIENCTHAGQQKWLVQKTVCPGRACVRLYTAFRPQCCKCLPPHPPLVPDGDLT